jgi:hypothetical protein
MPLLHIFHIFQLYSKKEIFVSPVSPLPSDLFQDRFYFTFYFNFFWLADWLVVIIYENCYSLFR